MGKKRVSDSYSLVLSMLNLLDEDGIVHGHAYEQECIALNALGDEIGHFEMYQNGYYHKYDQGKS